MFKSKVVAYVKPSSSCNVVLILGIGYGFLMIRLFSTLKSDIVRTVWSFFGMMKEGEAHLNVKRYLKKITLIYLIMGRQYFVFLFRRGTEQPHQGDMNTSTFN